MYLQVLVSYIHVYRTIYLQVLVSYMYTVRYTLQVLVSYTMVTRNGHIAGHIHSLTMYLQQHFAKNSTL